MQDSPIQIGTLSLNGFEIPPSVRFGGRYRLAVHTLYGGGRLIEQLGPDDGDITFEGTFTGPEAELRFRAFDALRLSGDVVWLAWTSFRRLVIVKSFEADYHSPWWIPYRICCVVYVQPSPLALLASSIAASITSDLGAALSFATASPVSLTPLQTALSASNAFTVGTSNQMQAASVTAETLAAINQQIALQGSIVMGAIGPSMDPASLPGALALAAASAGTLANAVNTGSYVGRIGINLNS